MDNLESPILTRYSEVKSTRIDWLWYPYIALGKITLLQGDPGDGKSTMMMNIIADFSKGTTKIQGLGFQKPCRVIYQCSEDGVSDTIKPRLERCGANCENVAFINEEVNNGLTLDDERIHQAIIEFRPSLVVIDPIQAYLGSESDLQIAGRARKLMHRLGLWASMYKCAIILVGHLNKKEGSKGLYRSLGSIDVVAAARSVLQVERNPDDDIRSVHQIKNSLASIGGELHFRISEEYGFQWIESETNLPIGGNNLVQDIYETKMEKATRILREILSEGSVHSIRAYEMLRENGVSQRTVELAKKEIGIICFRQGKIGYWRLPTASEYAEMKARKNKL